MYCAESVMPSELLVLAEVTNTMLAPLATAPAHSTSRSASVSSPGITPGSLPLTRIVGLFAGRPNVARKPETSLSLISVSPIMATFCPVPSYPAVHKGARL